MINIIIKQIIINTKGKGSVFASVVLTLALIYTGEWISSLVYKQNESNQRVDYTERKLDNLSANNKEK